MKVLVDTPIWSYALRTRKKEYQWRLDQKRANGALGDLGVHMIDLARWLVGDISQVSALYFGSKGICVVGSKSFFCSLFYC